MTHSDWAAAYERATGGNTYRFKLGEDPTSDPFVFNWIESRPWGRDKYQGSRKYRSGHKRSIHHPAVKRKRKATQKAQKMARRLNRK